ncbi:hypothetical protein [Janthinobacterium sp. MDT1-19]|uniref:hypothetical protein n=1 Tax=Janthinobacterium sp. MDT1-19 TaxID=1259339 RepID=UPI003F26C8DA
MKYYLNSLVESVATFFFRKKRTEFYSDWKRSIIGNELLVDFLRGEYEISMNKQTRNRSRAYVLKVMLRRALDGDETLPSRIIGLSMPAGDRMLLAAADGLVSESLVIVIEELCKVIQEQDTAKSELKSAMVLPGMLGLGLGTLCYVLSNEIIPIVENIAPEEVWTPLNSAVRWFANLVRFYGATGLGVIVISIGTFVYALPRWCGKSRFYLERVNPSIAVWLSPIIPILLPLSIYRDFQALMVLSSLSVLLKMGKTLRDALVIVAENSSPYLEFHIKRILYYIDDSPLEVAAAFTSGILSPQVAARFATVARTSSKYEDVLITAGTSGTVYIREEVEKNAVIVKFIFITLTISMTLFLYLGQQSITMSMQDEMSPSKIEQRRLDKVSNMK